MLIAASCGDNSQNDRNQELNRVQEQNADTLNETRESDYQNQSGSRTNSDTINQSGDRPEELE